jgi:hypothetical protein
MDVTDDSYEDAYGFSDTDYDEPDGPAGHDKGHDEGQDHVRMSQVEQGDFDGMDIGPNETLGNVTHARLDEDSSTDLDDSLNTVVEKSLDGAADDLQDGEPVDESVDEPVDESVDEPVDESVHEPVDESVDEQVALDDVPNESRHESDDAVDESRDGEVGEPQDGATDESLDQDHDQDQDHEQEPVPVQDGAHAEQQDAEAGEEQRAQEDSVERMGEPEDGDGQLAYMRYLEQVVRSTRRWGILLSKRGLLKMVLRAEFATDARVFEAIFAARRMSLEQTEDYVEFRQGRFAQVESVKGFDVFALEGGQVDEYMVQGPANRAAFTLFQELVDDLVRKNVYFRFGADSTCDQCTAARSPSSSPSSSLSCSPSSSPSSSDSK